MLLVGLLGLLEVLLFTFQVVFGQVAALAHAAGVVRTISVGAGGRQARLALSVIAVVAHVFRIMPHILMVADEKLTHLLRILLDFLQAFMSVLQVQCLQLESTDGVLVEFLYLGTRHLGWLARSRFSVGGLRADLANLVQLVDR